MIGAFPHLPRPTRGPTRQSNQHRSEWRRKQQHQPEGEGPGDPLAVTKTPPAAPQVPHPEPAPGPIPEPSPKLANDTSSPNLDPPHPALPIPSSTPEARTGFPPQPTASSTPFSTKPAPSGCPFLQANASLGGVAEVDKKPNFIEFYKISRSLESSAVSRTGYIIDNATGASTPSAWGKDAKKE